MGTIMGMSQTTACLPLSLLNDAGYLAFCESDFVVIPSGVLLHYISGLPVFLNDPTYQHDGVVTLAEFRKLIACSRFSRGSRGTPRSRRDMAGGCR